MGPHILPKKISSALETGRANLHDASEGGQGDLGGWASWPRYFSKASPSFMPVNCENDTGAIRSSQNMAKSNKRRLTDKIGRLRNGLVRGDLIGHPAVGGSKMSKHPSFKAAASGLIRAAMWQDG